MTENPFEFEFGKNEYFLIHKEEIIDGRTYEVWNIFYIFPLHNL